LDAGARVREAHIAAAVIRSAGEDALRVHLWQGWGLQRSMRRGRQRFNGIRNSSETQHDQDYVEEIFHGANSPLAAAPAQSAAIKTERFSQRKKSKREEAGELLAAPLGRSQSPGRRFPVRVLSNSEQ
jgi:hypothetical protein